MSTVWKVLAVMGIPLGAFVIYKMQDKECIQDMKQSLDNMTKKASNSMKNMMG